jgi:hypothetical protein
VARQDSKQGKHGLNHLTQVIALFVSILFVGYLVKWVLHLL